ncbi:MAG: hypothetical protein ACYC9L_04730, partial [Sulfuricaulis sp.]
KGMSNSFYWCYTPNSGDSGGILDSNLNVRQDKMALLQKLWGSSAPAGSATDATGGSNAPATAGAPLPAAAGSSSGSGGCTIAKLPSSMTNGGDWILVSLFLAFVALVRRRSQRERMLRVNITSAKRSNYNERQ